MAVGEWGGGRNNATMLTVSQSKMGYRKETKGKGGAGVRNAGYGRRKI